MKFFPERAIWDDSRLRRRIVTMAVEFCVEASVLISVLGILDSAISTHGVPGFRVFLISGGVGILFFALGCILEANQMRAKPRASDDAPENLNLEEGNDSGNS